MPLPNLLKSNVEPTDAELAELMRMTHETALARHEQTRSAFSAELAEEIQAARSRSTKRLRLKN